MKEFLLFTLLLMPEQGHARSEIQIKGFKNYGILILCKFDDQYDGKKKYFCKGDTICPYNQTTHSKDSRVSQYGNASGNYLAVNITNLAFEDAGTYHCAVENGGFAHNIFLNVTEGDCCDSHTTEPKQNISSQCKHPMESKESPNDCCQQDAKFIRYLKEVNQSHKHLLNHSLDAGVYWCGIRTGGPLMVIGGTTQHINIKGFAGGGILIHCKFHNEDTQKNFCRGNDTVCTKGSRIWLHKNVLWGYLTVIFLNLTSNDNGTYHFMEDKDVRAEVHLHVVEGDCCVPPMTIKEDEGGNVTIDCRYPGELKNNHKHLCKAKERCKPLGYEPNTKQKYSLSDNKTGHSFTVTIHDLEMKDAGSYWCGVKANEYYAILLNNVVLNISDKQHAETDTTTPVLVVTVVLLLAVIVLLCYKDRQSRKNGRSNKEVYYTTENPDPDRIYEEIEDIGLPPHPVTSSTCSVVTADKTDTPNYCTIQSTLNPPDETHQHLLSKGTHSSVITTVYTTAQLSTVTTPFPTIPADVPTYSNIQLLSYTSTYSCPKIGGDETESCIYVNVQEPTDPNDGPTTYTDQSEDPTNSVNQEPTNTNEDTL